MTALLSAMDESYEKPLLTCEPCSERLPIVLSGENVYPPIQVPASISRFLRNYQRDGVRFLYDRFKVGEGCLLADDMGLGKTIQAIAFIAAVLHMKGTKEDKLRHCSAYIRNDVAPGIEVPSVDPVLIICPASLTDNWIYEFHVWGYFKVNKISTANKLELINQAIRRECDVVIVTFETARSMIHDLNSVDWTCVLVDEVHRIKDTSSQVWKALSSLHCKRRFGFTGTPFQNNINEVLCLLKWSNPEAITKFMELYDISRLMEKALRSSATKQDCAEKFRAQFKFTQVRAKLMLRRTKDILAKHLPSKTDQVVFCELTEVQQNIYRMITQSTDIKKMLSKDGCKDKKSRKTKTGLLFTYMHLLLKTANHVGLLASGLSSRINEVARQVCEEALEQFADLEGIPKKKWFAELADVNMSGKMLVLSKLLPSFLEKGDKVLLFSYSTKVLDLVQTYITKKRFKFWRLDGRTPIDSRLSLVTSFNMYPHPAIFLLSTKAGGVGLNMTGANVVIIFDPNWNPAHDLQAQDRAYRLGQQRDVRVYRLLSTATIEEFVYLRQVYKQQLGTTSLTNKNTRRYFDGELFGIKNLFSFRESSRSLTEELLEKQQKLERKLRLKLEAPIKEKSSKAFFSTCAIAINGKGDGMKDNCKSGLTQLCEDVFQTSCVHPVMEESEDSLEGYNDEEPCDDVSDENCDESITTLLEKTSEVRHVVKHQIVVAPSKVEDFVADCAIRDVFEKKINFQRPAFDCSVDTEDMMVDEEQVAKQKSLQSTLCRLKFNHLAKMEKLTPYQLASNVLSMSLLDKQNLLRKYQEGQHKLSSENPSSGKRARSTSLASSTTHFPEALCVDNESPVKSCKLSSSPSTNEVEHEANISNKAFIMDQCAQPVGLMMDVPHQSGFSTYLGGGSLAHVKVASDRAKSSSQLSDNSESSFERETKKICPDLSKETVKVLESMFSNKRKTSHRAKPTSNEDCPVEIRSHLSSTDKFVCLSSQAGSRASTEASSDECKEKKIRTEMDDIPSSIDESGCSKEASAFLDSMFISTKRLPSPKKRFGASSTTDVGKLPCAGLLNEDHDEAASCPSSSRLTCSSTVSIYAAKSSVQGPNLSNFSCPAKTKQYFRPEDDIIKKLIASGKLKHNRD